jgi:hypothetical protein
MVKDSADFLTILRNLHFFGAVICEMKEPANEPELAHIKDTRQI